MCQLHQEPEYISQQFVPSSNSWLKKQKTTKQKPKNKKLVCKKNAPDSNLNKGLLHGWNVVISAAPHVIKWQQCHSPGN